MPPLAFLCGLCLKMKICQPLVVDICHLHSKLSKIQIVVLSFTLVVIELESTVYQSQYQNFYILDQWWPHTEKSNTGMPRANTRLRI